MNSNVLTQTIVTGSDPRGLPEFSAIREEINKASHPSQPELNWKLVESLALAIFKANGVDLHTATYYTLARTRTQGLADGFHRLPYHMRDSPLDGVIDVVPQVAAKQRSVGITAARCTQNDVYCLVNIIQSADVFFRPQRGRLPVQR